MTPPIFSISIIVIDQLELTRKCIDSVLQYSKDFELIITDNGSGPDMVAYLKTLAENNTRIGIIRNEFNVGFGAAHNRALSFAHGLYFVTLNNDAEVCPDWLEKMRAQFRDPKVAQVGLSETCRHLDHEGRGYLNISSAEAEYIEAACMMIPVPLAREVGLFRTAFHKAYCEDSDLSLMLRSRGYKLAHIPLNIKHERASTATSLPKSEDIQGCRVYNHHLFITDWARYLKQRNFKRRVLVRRMNARGDAFLITPVIHEMKRRFPEMEITVQTAHPHIFANNPDVFQCCETLPSGAKFDESFDLDLAYEREPRKHIVQAYADVCRIPVQDFRPRIYLTAQDRAWAKSKLDDGRWVAIHTGPTAWPGRNWPHSRFIEVANQLRGEDWKVVLVGHTDVKIPADLDLRSRTPSPQSLAAVIERCGLFVGIDSFPMHLALSARIPTVGIFGCIDPKYRMINWNFVRGVTSPDVGCLGCHHIQSAPRTDSKCLRERPYCMLNLHTDYVIDAIHEILEVYKMFSETAKVRDRVLEYCKGKGIDIGCGREKITPDCIGFDDDTGVAVDQLGNAAGRMPYNDGYFDYVYSSHCLEDILDTEMTLREWLRILKPQGFMILYVPHPELYKDVNLEHKHKGFTPKQLSEFLIPLGCRIVHEEIDTEPGKYSSLVIAQKK